MQSDVTRAHYDRLADTYDENWAYSPEFIAWMTSGILARLKLARADRVLDVGCGTGLYSCGLAEQADVVVCTDPSSGMLAQLPNDERLLPVHAGAEDLTQGRVRLPHDGYDAILLKEVVHHLPDPSQVLSDLSGLLRPGGRILVVMLPMSIGYPLFDAALRLFQERQPDPQAIATALTDAGLNADLTYEEFPLAFTVERYARMVRSRYMSLLSSFDDAQIEEGIAEIRRRHPGPELRFPDRFAFVTGVKA
ncbi:class I SAM-dependent methyltransferase [Streptosporangium sp. KLBMP 9127]|nr:methyltransferase domain-containing protein [Streptosporangium sp. KLBMP 9127]